MTCFASSRDWQARSGSSAAGSVAVTLRSLDRTEVSIDVLAPTDLGEGSLSIGLVTSDGVPLAEFGLDPIVLPLEFVRVTDHRSAGRGRRTATVTVNEAI